MRSTIYIAKLSVVDHGYIDDKGRQVGGSFYPGFTISGGVDSHESVVVDFSTIKHDIKDMIDQHTNDPYTNGFDHKLWWIEGVSLGTIEFTSNRAEIVTPACRLSVPIDAIRVITGQTRYAIEDMGAAMEAHVQSMLSEKYPDVGVSVSCFNSVEPLTIDHSPLAFFRYSHGLKNSTSYGCQNISHGHLSYIQSIGDSIDDDLLGRIADELDNVVFINDDNVVHEDNDNLVIQYVTPRGRFSAEYKKGHNNILILRTETTIEYIAEFVKDFYGVDKFFISEGLQKGAIVN